MALKRDNYQDFLLSLHLSNGCVDMPLFAYVICGRVLYNSYAIANRRLKKGLSLRYEFTTGES